MQLDWTFPYPSRRMPVLARNVVATSQPLAAQAGLAVLQRGGNAVDAAIATAITLTVVEPTSNGIGSDAFALVWEGGKLHGLNASGRSPAAWTPERFAGLDAMPYTGWDSVTVPGCVSAWTELWRRFGKLPFPALFEAGIRYAEEGFLVSPITAAAWASAEERFRSFEEFARVFLPDGRAPRPGEHFALPDQARTLQRIAESEGEDFYRGALADKIAAASERAGGALSREDLAAHRPEWVEPIRSDFHGLTLAEIPPNGQGLAALMALGILKHHGLGSLPPDSAESLHLQIEAMKLALSDAYQYIADAEAMREVSWREMLSAEYLASRAREIDPQRARAHPAGMPVDRGTVYLTAADESGMMVSLIQSNFCGFGSGVVVPHTGISLQNRGYGFSLEEGHPNQVGPRKRPFHTIIPGFVLRDGQPLMSFGVMGGSMQAQGHVQMMARLAVHGQNPQAASDAPRWRVESGKKVLIEEGMPAAVIESLRQMGHEIEQRSFESFGGAQLIYNLGGDGYCAASDSRKDGQAAGY